MTNAYRRSSTRSMDAFDDTDLLFDSFLPLPENQSCNAPEPFSEDEILEDNFDDSAPIQPTEYEGDYDGRPESCAAARDRDWVIEQIESIIERVVDGLLLEDQQLTISLKTRSGLSRRQANHIQGASPAPAPRSMDFNYPGNTAQDSKRFTIVLRILELIHGCLVDNVTMTRRDIYYRHPSLFGKQSVVDRYVDDIACTLGISRSLLNVTAAAKGLMAGNVTIRRSNGSSACGLSEPEGVLIPAIQEDEMLDLPCVRWILVIEKEATFRSILISALWQELRTQALMITAKGYPDLLSRKFMSRLSEHAPHIPMLALVDLDPDGIHIMSTYKYGSLRLLHEDVTQTDTPGVNLPNLQWLGIQSHHINRKPGNEGGTTTAALADAQGVLRLTVRDRKKAGHMLEWGVCGEHGSEPAWRAELQCMLMLNVKAEMQILDELPGGLVSWLGNQLDVMQGGSADDELLF